MSLLRAFIIAVAAVSGIGTAVAFQEQRQGSPVPQAAPSAQPDQRPAEFSAPNAADAGKASGAEVRIPGLGKLGNLPNMDFGLELLYGVAEPKQVLPVQREDQRDDDLTIRGTVRHKF